VCVCVCERESEWVCLRERERVCESERWRAWVCDSKRERQHLGREEVELVLLLLQPPRVIHLRQRVREGERERVSERVSE
jgi:hypothetical protein